jgi:polysaccharide deacetylase 2 family uncharacterized protein YibQ
MLKKRGKYRRGKDTTKFFFIIFISIAVFSVIFLEYIDFNKGKKSFIFTKIIHLKKAQGKEEKFNADFLRILDKNKIEYDLKKDEENKYHIELKIDNPRYKALIGKIATITEKLKGNLELSEVQGKVGKSIMLYKITLDQRVSHWILITRLSEYHVKSLAKDTKDMVEKSNPKKRRRRGSPKIAFVIDDIGDYDIGALKLKSLDIPITASILPNSSKAHEEAIKIQQLGLKAIIHMPMQPQNGNGSTYGNDKTITVNSKDREIKELIKNAKKKIPNAKGVNNHQGSLVTSNREVMFRILKIIKREGLYFFDSRTISNSVAFDTAKRLGVKTAYKDVFLDHGEKTYANSINWIKRLVEIALQKGQAIAIGHPYETTLRAIKDSIGYIKSKGIEIVFLSELLE